MNKGLKGLIAGLILFIASIFGLEVTVPDFLPIDFGGSQEARFNTINELTRFTTSTDAYCIVCPVKVLDLDSNRRYALFQNNTATDLWLFSTVDTWTIDGLSGTAASSTITALNGILLEAKKAGAPVSTYELTPDNMIYGHIWASTTASGVEIIVNYK